MISAHFKSLWSRLQVEARELNRWNSHTVSCDNEVRVYYGYEHVPGKNEKSWGGLVKLQDLVTSFPNQPVASNILYFVSSGLPMHATRIAALALKRNCRVVLNQNGVAYPAWCKDGWQAINVHMSEILHKADWVFYQSKFSKLASDEFLGNRDSGFEILYNPVDTRFFVPNRSWSGDGTGIRLLLAGSHGREYRVKKAIQALSVLKKSGVRCQLLIAGRLVWRTDEHVAASEIYEMAKKEDVLSDIELVGQYTQAEAVSMFQRADILLHTTYNDVCPRLVVEAMSCGLPIVYSKSGGVPELVGDSAGIGVPAPLDWYKEHPPSPDALSYAVQQVSAEYQQYSESARLRAVEKFDVKSWIKRHGEVFKSLLSQ